MSDEKTGLLGRLSAKVAALLPFLGPKPELPAAEEAASNSTWPDLNDIGSVGSRPATTEDVKRGHAAFLLSAVDGVSTGVPLNLAIPQYAWHVDEDDGTRTPVVVIQAEGALGYEVAGFLNIENRETVVSLLRELELLGNEKPQ